MCRSCPAGICEEFLDTDHELSEWVLSKSRYRYDLVQNVSIRCVCVSYDAVFEMSLSAPAVSLTRPMENHPFYQPDRALFSL